MESASPSFEPSESTYDRYPLERLGLAMREAADRLSMLVKPDYSARIAQDIPYGQFGEGRLTTNIFTEMGWPYGSLELTAPDDKSFLLQRGVCDPGWRRGNSSHDDAYALRALDYNLPRHLIDNHELREAIDNSPTIHDVARIVNCVLEPHAAQVSHYKRYDYVDIIIENTLREVCTSLSINTTAARGNEWTLESLALTTTLSHQHQGIDTPLQCTAATDPMGVSLQASYTDPESSLEVDVPISDTDSIVALFEEKLQAMLDEKTA